MQVRLRAMCLGSATAGAFACLLAIVAAPAVAAPANDDFADREVLSGSLPIALTGTNVEATKEVGEPSPAHLGFAATGHSVWFEWEATGTGFVTVSTCGSSIRSVLGVYTGTSVGALSEVAGDFSSLGPDCPAFDGVAVTFKATSGAAYEIVVDGLVKFPGEGTDVSGQGAIALEVEATPSPANDDFADATVLDGRTLEGGVYAAGAAGFTWNATKEAGEPLHAGNPGGASVWYSWLAPSSDVYGLSACGGFGTTLLGVYTGNSVTGLTRVAADDHSCSFLRFSANLGTTYRIAVDGKFDSGSGAAAMGSISVNVFREPPETPIERPIAQLADVFPPDTTISKRTARPALRGTTFTFRSSESGSTFRCLLDGRKAAPCSSPKRYAGLAPGRHRFSVYALDGIGNADPTPATVRFSIAKPRHRQR